MKTLVLASGSPRRRELLTALEFKFEILTTDVDESAPHTDAPPDFALRLAVEKANAAYAIWSANADPSAPPPVIIAADTIVVLGGEILGKPTDCADAAAMLGRLSGRTHTVITGLAIQTGPQEVWAECDRTDVTFRELSKDAIDRYVATGSAQDKAGAYGVQETGKEFIESVQGDLSNVIGLPLGLLRRGLRESTGQNDWRDKSLREAVFRAYPELKSFSAALLSGVPE